MTLSIIITAVAIIGLKYSFDNLKRADALSQSRPSFTIDDDITFSPEKPKVGEDITVTGTIRPREFTIDAPENNIVLVLDVSGSMSEKVSVSCTNERGEYWVEEKWGYEWVWTGWRYEWKYVKISDGYWIHDYCEEHNKSGEHTHESTKMIELKKAANSFVEKMKDVPNLKIGIVAYSSYAWVNPNGSSTNTTTKSLDQRSSHNVPKYTLLGDSLLDINNPKLTNMINSLQPLGGTNTGEGIRKGIALLKSGNKSAKKTLILMSDGLPTFYSVSGSTSNQYMDIDFKNPNYRGSGSDDSSGKNLQYAKAIGGIVKEKSYNAFTIGYGLNNDGNNKMKQIHNSMTGIDLSNSSNEEYNEEKGFFATSDGAIDGVFNTIADKIIKEYPVDNGVFTDGMIEGINLGVGSDTVSIHSMLYKSDGVVKAGKLTYTCEPYNFSFVIKASKTGIFENVFNNSNISFPWKDDEKIECQMPVKQLEIEDNTLPIIQAKLQNNGEEITGLNQGDNFEIVYDIIPKDFELNSSDDGTGLKDIVVLIDTSSSMAGNNKLVPLLNSIDNQIVSKFTDNDSKTEDNTQIAFVTYNSKINIYTEGGDGNPFLKTQGNLHNKILEIRNEPLNDPERNVEVAIKEAEKILNSNYAQRDASKNIIIISSDQVDDYQTLDKDSIKNGNYNIISIELRKEKNKEIDSFKELHIELGGEIDSYMASNPDGGNYNDLESVMRRAAEKISLSRKTLYEFNSVQLGFDVGSKLTPLSEVVISTDGNENEKEAMISEKRIIIDLPAIQYRYNSDINMYQSQPFQVKFRVTIDGEGIIEFNKNRNDDIRNYIQFEKINKTSPKNRIEDTPSIIVENSMRHGIYDSEAEGNIDETLTKKIPQDAVVPMAGYFETFSDGQRIEIQLNQGLEACGKVQIINTETSETISSNALFNDNNYEQNIDSKGKYLVLYSVKVNSVNNTKVTLRKYNTSTSNPQEKSYQIQVGNVLPDLF